MSPLLNAADKVLLGERPVDAVYAGAAKVWPTLPETLFLPLAWYDTASLAALPDQSALAVWPDSSPNDLDLTPTVSGAAPTFAVDGGDGRPAVVWPGDGRRGLRTPQNVGLTGAEPWTQVIVFRRGTAVNQSLTGLGVEGPLQMVDAMAFNHPWDGTPVFIGHMYGGGNDTFAYAPPPLAADGRFHTLSAVYDGRLILTSDGIKQSPWPGVLTLGDAPFRVGDGAYSAQPGLYGNSMIRGVALYDRVLTDAEIDAVGAALA